MPAVNSSQDDLKIEIHLSNSSLPLLKRLLREALEESILTKQISGKDPPDTEKLWITQTEARQLLPLRSRTSWQRIRDLQLVEFSKIGNILLYNKQSLLKYINNHKTTTYK